MEMVKELVNNTGVQSRQAVVKERVARKSKVRKAQVKNRALIRAVDKIWTVSMITLAVWIGLSVADIVIHNISADEAVKVSSYNAITMLLDIVEK